MTPTGAVPSDVLPSGALRIDITPHKRKPGTQRPFVETVGGLEGMGLPSVDVKADTVSCDLAIEMVGEQITVTGTVASDWMGPCRRCLEPMTATVSVKVHEIFEIEPVEGETYRREKDFADLRPMVIENIVLSLPVAPLCRDDCPGPAPDQISVGIAPDPSEVDAAPAGDPRWAALDALKFDE